MSRIIYFTQNESSGFQISSQVMDILQTELQDLIRGFICTTGNNVILCGVTGPSGGNIYTEGLIVWNNEFLFFEGGVFGQYLSIQETTVDLIFCDNTVHEAYTIRTAKFSATATAESIAVTNVSGLGIFEFVVNNQQLVDLINQNATNLTNAVATINASITNLTNIVNQNALLNSDVIGDVKYLSNITDFNFNGIGNVGTPRQGWALVSASNNLWKAPLGYTGTYSAIDGRGLVIAGATYPILTTFGVDDITLTANQSGLRGHTHTASVTGSNTPVNNEIQTATGDGNTSAPDINRVRNGADTNYNGANSSVFTNPTHNHNWSGTVTVNGVSSDSALESHENRQPSIALYLAVKYQ